MDRGTLFVLREYRKVINRRKRRYYEVLCSKCSKDTELYPANFDMLKDTFDKGSYPCGCAKKPCWSKDQYEVKIKRTLQSRGLKLATKLTGTLSKTTKLPLYCEHCNTVDEYSLSTVLYKNFNCKHCLKNKKHWNSKKSSEILKVFKETEYFKQIESIIRCTEDKNYWFISCNVCKNDKYSVAGVSGYIFRTYIGSLNKGSIPCRCAPRGNKTENELKFDLKVVMEKHNCFYQTPDKLTIRSKIPWVCDKGHKNTTVLKTLRNSVTCKSCLILKQKQTTTLYGLYPERLSEEDYLYLMVIGGDYFKIGRSFSPRRRLWQIKNKTGIDNVEIIKLHKGSHGFIYDKEQELHKVITALGGYHEESIWSTETFKSSFLDFAIKWIDNLKTKNQKEALE